MGQLNSVTLGLGLPIFTPTSFGLEGIGREDEDAGAVSAGADGSEGFAGSGLEGSLAAAMGGRGQLAID